VKGVGRVATVSSLTINCST